MAKETRSLEVDTLQSLGSKRGVVDTKVDSQKAHTVTTIPLITTGLKYRWVLGSGRKIGAICTHLDDEGFPGPHGLTATYSYADTTDIPKQR